MRSGEKEEKEHKRKEGRSRRRRGRGRKRKEVRRKRRDKEYRGEKEEEKKRKEEKRRRDERKGGKEGSRGRVRPGPSENGEFQDLYFCSFRFRISLWVLPGSTKRVKRRKRRDVKGEDNYEKMTESLYANFGRNVSQGTIDIFGKGETGTDH